MAALGTNELHDGECDLILIILNDYVELLHILQNYTVYNFLLTRSGQTQYLYQTKRSYMEVSTRIVEIQFRIVTMSPSYCAGSQIAQKHIFQFLLKIIVTRIDHDPLLHVIKYWVCVTPLTNPLTEFYFIMVVLTIIGIFILKFLDFLY